MPHASPISFLFDHMDNILWGVQIMKLFTVQSPPVPCCLIPLSPRCLPQHCILIQPQLMFLLQGERPSFTPIQKSSNVPWLEKITATGSLGAKCVMCIPVNFLPRVTSLNSYHYIETLRISALTSVRLVPQMSEVLFLHDSARPHINVCTTEAITEVGWMYSCCTCPTVLIS
jgi:hypothetical protein